MMIRFLRFAAAAFLLSPMSLSVELLKPPSSANNENGATIISSQGGAVRSKGEWTMERQNVQGQRLVRFTETGSGLYSPFDREVRWTMEAVWTAEDSFRPLRSERTVTDMSGRQLVKERKSFDFEKGSVEIVVEDSSQKSPSRRTLKIPSDTLTVDGIAGALRSLPFEPSRPVELHLLSNEPKLYDVTFQLRGRERVRTPAGEFDCYKVELIPGLGVLNVFRFLVPEAFFWFTVDAPHSWVRYEGPENGRGTPQIVMERAR